MNNVPKFAVGQKVIYTNPQGVCWGERTITEIEYWESGKDARYFITPTDTPWFSIGESCCSEIK